MTLSIGPKVISFSSIVAADAVSLIALMLPVESVNIGDTALGDDDETSAEGDTIVSSTIIMSVVDWVGGDVGGGFVGDESPVIDTDALHNLLELQPIVRVDADSGNWCG